MAKSSLKIKGKAFVFPRGIVLTAMLFAVFFAGSSYLTASATDTLPSRMNFQGRLTNSTGNILTDGTYNMKFRIYSATTGGTLLWSEDRLVSASQGVTVTNGQFSVQLGSVTSLPASLFTTNSLHFEVELPTPATATTTSPSWTEGPMSPRNQLATSAYAFNADMIDGIDGSNLAQLDQNNTFSGNNTFAGTIQGGSSLTLGTTSQAGSLVISDGSSNTATLQVASLAGNYTYTIPVTTANDTLCLEALANCAGAGGVTTIGALDGGTANANGATISGTTLHLQSASATNAGLVNTISQTFAGDKMFSGNINVQSGLLVTDNVQAVVSTTGDLLVAGVVYADGGIDTSAGGVLGLGGSASSIDMASNVTVAASKTLTIGTVANGVIVSDTGITLAGTARGTKTVTLVPEYPGATFRGDGTDNNGSLSSDLCSATTGGLGINTTVCATANDEHNYYEWSNTQATAQDYDIYVRYKLPADYSTGSLANFQFSAQGATASEAASLTLISAGTTCLSTGDIVTGAGTWSNGFSATPLGACTPAAGDYLTMKITLSATQNNAVRAGEITMTYRSTF